MLFALLITSLAALWRLPTTSATCHDPSPVFPPPEYKSGDTTLLDAFSRVQDSFNALTTSPQYNTTSFSIQVTSSHATLWSSYHTAREKNNTRPGAKRVQGDSAFRIASITKTFTTLALLQLHEAGNLSLDDPVIHYLPHLTGSLPWKDITLRILASQLSGIPRDWTGSQGDLITQGNDSWRFGLPPPAKHNNDHLPNCYSFSDDYRPCGEADLYQAVKHLQPVFAPNFKSTYSNMAFEVLGLVVASASGLKYEDYIQQRILDVIGMKGSTFKVPPDSVAVLPKGSAWFFDVDEGIHNPTGGLYSTADDLSKYLRYILTHFNALATGVNWLQPHSFTFDGGESFYGMPWEIFRTTNLLRSGRSERPVTFYTKGGGVPGYLSYIIAVPDFGLGFSILVAGEPKEISGLVDELRELVTVPIVRAAEAVAGTQMKERYEGRFVFEKSFDTAAKLNSSLTLSWDAREGLTISEFVSNGTESLKAFQSLEPSWRDPGTKFQLLPTLLHADEEKQQGERWRILIVPPLKPAEKPGVWDGFCITNVDMLMYDGNPLNEMILWAGKDGKIEKVEPTAFRVTLRREQEQEGPLVIQEL